MEKHQKTILIELMNKETVSGHELSSLIQMSTRSVRTIIKNICKDIQGAKIESGTFGYKLIIECPETFLSYLQQSENEDNDETRLKYLFDKFMNANDYLKIDDLCEEIYLSRTQLKQTLKELRMYFQNYGITINSKAHYGMYLDGKELDKRRSIAHFELFQKDLILVNKIKNIIISSIVNADYVISDDILNNLISHLYIAYIRVNRKEYAVIDEEWIAEIKEEKEYDLACSIMLLMKQMMNMEYREEEVAYLTMHLCGKNCKQYANTYIDQTIFDLIEKILLILEEESKISLTSDLNLQLALALHTIPLMKRIQYQTYIHNPLINDIKANYIVAYELAVKACELINHHFHCQLPEDEIGYFALHINLSLEQKKIDIHKKNILLVCSSGVGSARLLEYFFKENFHSYIHELKVCSLYELENQDIDRYDCIFTTVPIQQELSIPIFMISHLMSHKDTLKITDSLKNLHQMNILKYFPKELFLQYETFQTKEEAIHEIIQQCQKYYQLPDQFEQLILEREALATTEFNDLVAFPHSPKPVTDKTFVSVAILKKPLLWKKHKIRIILLSSVENKVFKDIDDFYKVISTFISDQSMQWQLIHHPTYEFFCKMIEGGE